MFQSILNALLFRSFRVRKTMEEWLRSIETESAEEFLKLLLKLMDLAFLVNLKGFRRNIEGFGGKYLFRSKDGGITVSAVFKGSRLKVSEETIEDADLAVVFRDGKALMGYLLSPKPDILGSMLRQDVVPEGNLNYLYKFAFMATRLQLMAKGAL